MANYQSGGAFLPNGDMLLNGTVTIGPSGTLTTQAGATVNFSGATSVNFSGTTSGVTMAYAAQNVTATGTGSTDATALTGVYPAFIVISTGATGSGVSIPAAAAVPGAVYYISNQVAATMRIYSSGATINGTTGTTAYQVTNTGNKWVMVGCAVAGAWIASGNT